MCSGAVRNALNLGLDGVTPLDLCFSQVVSRKFSQNSGVVSKPGASRNAMSALSYDGLIQLPTDGQP